jgi:hypothetical protein
VAITYVVPGIEGHWCTAIALNLRDLLAEIIAMSLKNVTHAV